MKGDSDYIASIGPSWANARGWHRTWPGQPFVGVRVDRDDVWVACEPLIAGQPISTDAREELERLFDQAGRDAWIDERVFLFRATNLREALAGRATCRLPAPIDGETTTALFEKFDRLAVDLALVTLMLEGKVVARANVDPPATVSGSTAPWRPTPAPGRLATPRQRAGRRVGPLSRGIRDVIVLTTSHTLFAPRCASPRRPALGGSRLLRGESRPVRETFPNGTPGPWRSSPEIVAEARLRGHRTSRYPMAVISSPR